MTDEDLRKMAVSFGLPYAVYYKELILFGRAILQAATRDTPSADTDFDVEVLMDRWGIPSHLRDRFRSPMRKLVVCKKQDAASAPKGDGNEQ